jgi:hypothetical protein
LFVHAIRPDPESIMSKNPSNAGPVLTPGAADACKRAARALTAYLTVCGERPLDGPQLNLIRALYLIEVHAERPFRDPARLMGLVAHFYQPTQLEFAVELLGERLSGAEGEGEAILAELDLVAREIRAAALPR